MAHYVIEAVHLLIQFWLSLQAHQSSAPLNSRRWELSVALPQLYKMRAFRSQFLRERVPTILIQTNWLEQCMKNWWNGPWSDGIANNYRLITCYCIYSSWKYSMFQAINCYPIFLHNIVQSLASQRCHQFHNFHELCTIILVPSPDCKFQESLHSTK